MNLNLKHLELPDNKTHAIELGLWPSDDEILYKLRMEVLRRAKHLIDEAIRNERAEYLGENKS